MSQEITPEPRTGMNTSPATNSESVRPSGNVVRHNQRDTPFAFSTKDFEGATPKIGGVLGLCSETVTKKVSYDTFLKS